MNFWPTPTATLQYSFHRTKALHRLRSCRSSWHVLLLRYWKARGRKEHSEVQLRQRKRDFTYVDDIVESMLRVIKGAPAKATGDDGLSLQPYAVYNIGGGTPENLLNYISTPKKSVYNSGFASMKPNPLAKWGTWSLVLVTKRFWVIIISFNNIRRVYFLIYKDNYGFTFAEIICYLIVFLICLV